MDKLVVGKALTGQGLLSLVAAVKEQQGEAAASIRRAFVDAVAGIDFQSGKAIFKDARKATDNKPLLVRLSEAHAIFTAMRLTAFDGGTGGWSLSVEAARARLKAAKLTVAGNERKDEDEREADRAKRQAAGDQAAALQTLPPNATDEQAIEHLRKVRQERAAQRTANEFPVRVIALAKMLADSGEDLDAAIGYAGTIPQDLREALELIEAARDVVISYGTEFAKVRADAKAQREAQAKAEAELKAQANADQQVKAAA